MKTRIGFTAKYYATLLLIFILEKPLFMLFTKGDTALHFSDYIKVIRHGVPMDLAVAGYLTIIPWLMVLIAVWWPLTPNFNAKKVLKPYNMLIAALLAIIFVADIALYPFWQFKLDSSVFIYLATPSEAFASVSAGYIIIRVLAIVVVAYMIFKMLKRVSPNTFNPGEANNHRKIVCTVMMLILAGAMFIGIRGGVKESTMNVGRVYFCDNQYLNHSAVNPAFSLFASLGKRDDYGKEYRFMEDSQAQSIADAIYPAKGGAGNPVQNSPAADEEGRNLLSTQRPDILVIVMESFGSTVTMQNIDGAPVTPYFWEEAEQGILFSNLYCNSYRTDRGMVSVFSGWPAFPKVSLMKQPKIVQHLPSVAEELAKAGYNTGFLYGGDINFTNTKGYLITTGFQNIVSDVDFPAKERKSSSKWGVQDEYTFDYLLKQLTSREPHPSMGEASLPSFTGFLTLSSHEPFIVPFGKFTDKVYNAAAYTDYCLGHFLKELKQSSAWDNLLVIILPDHNLLYRTSYSSPSYFHNQMLWTGGAIKERRIIDTPLNQSDLAATLLAQLGMDNSMFPYSRDIFAPGYNPVTFSCYNNGFMVHDHTGSTTFDLNSHKVVESAASTAGSTEGSEDNRRVETGKAILQVLYNTLSIYDK